MLEYEAKRNNTLADLMNNIANLSESEIKVAKVKLPWMRKALLELKNIKNSQLLELDISQFAILGNNSDPIGYVKSWIGNETFIQIGRNQLEVKYGQLFWFGSDGVWIDTIHSKIIDPKLNQLTKSEGKMSRSMYIQTIRDKARDITCVDNVQQSSRFQIFRP
jgi:hypothetical protein